MMSWLLAKLAICGDMHPISLCHVLGALQQRNNTYLGIQYASSLSVLQSFNKDRVELLFLCAHSWELGHQACFPLGPL